MTKKYSNPIAVKVADDMYSTLLFEAGGNTRNIPDVIRKKIKESHLGTAEAQTLLKQQNLLISLVKQVLMNNVPVTTRMAGLVDGFEPQKKQAEKERFEKTLVETLDAIARATKEAGL